MIFNRFLKDQQGMITVEFAFVSLALMALIFFSMDTGMYIMEKNKIERVNYSLVTVIRERGRLYDNNPEITQEEIDNLGVVAAKLINSSLADNIKVKVEALYFDETSTKSNPVIKTAASFMSQNSTLENEAQCFSGLTNINNLKNHTVWVDSKGWLPIFRVSVCASNRNKTPMPYFEYGNNVPSKFITSSIAIIR